MSATYINTKPLGLGLTTNANSLCAGIDGATVNCSSDEQCENIRTCPIGWKTNQEQSTVHRPEGDFCQRTCSCELNVHTGNEDENEKNWQQAGFLSWIRADGVKNDNCAVLKSEQDKTLNDVFKLRCCLGFNNLDSATIVDRPFSRDHMCSPQWHFNDPNSTCDDVVQPYCSIPKNFKQLKCQLYCNAKDSHGVRSQNPSSWCYDATKKFCEMDNNMLESPLCMNMYYQNRENVDHRKQLDEFMINHCYKQQELGRQIPPECACILSTKSGSLLFDPACDQTSPAYKTLEMENMQKDSQFHDKTCRETIDYCKLNRINFLSNFNEKCNAFTSQKSYFYGCNSSGDCVLKNEGPRYENDPTCANSCSLRSLSNGVGSDKTDCDKFINPSSMRFLQMKSHGKIKYIVLIVSIALIIFILVKCFTKRRLV